MEKENKLLKIFKNWRVLLWISCTVIAFLLVSNVIPVNSDKEIGFGNGLDYGMDFSGGIRVTLKLEKSVDSETMNVEKQILQDRLNGLGLKDMKIVPLMDKYIAVEVVNASAQDIEQIENILKKQAKFEARVDGEVALIGDEIKVDLGPQGQYVSPTAPSQWFVAIKNTVSGGERFCSVAKGKQGKPIDMFLDRPENTFIIMLNSTFEILSGINDEYGNTMIEVIEKRASVPILKIENGTLPDTEELSKFMNLNLTHVILAGDEEQLSVNLWNFLQEKNFTVERKEKKEHMTNKDWALSLINLQSSPRLNCDPCSECKYSAQLSGTAPTVEEARLEVKRNKILLSSGNLPVKLEIGKKSEISPVLGGVFLYYSFLIGIVSSFIVASMIFLKYRKFFIVAPIICIAVSEIIITLGFSSIIPVGGKLGWELDLSAIAGIITAVGTGVDDQIVITDETLRREREKKVMSILERLKSAFFIVFTSAFTVVAVMLPLFTIQELRGFAFTTLLGIAIGIIITRPAYAHIISELLEG